MLEIAKLLRDLGYKGDRLVRFAEARAISGSDAYILVKLADHADPVIQDCTARAAEDKSY